MVRHKQDAQAVTAAMAKAIVEITGACFPEIHSVSGRPFHPEHHSDTPCLSSLLIFFQPQSIPL